MADTIQVVSDCANANEVACECTTPDNFHVRVKGALDGKMTCVAHCAPYGGE